MTRRSLWRSAWIALPLSLGACGGAPAPRATGDDARAATPTLPATAAPTVAPRRASTREPGPTPAEEAERLIAAYIAEHPSPLEPPRDPPRDDRDALSRVLPALLGCAGGRLTDDGLDAASLLVVRVVIGPDGAVRSSTLDGERSALHRRDAGLVSCFVAAHASLVFPPGAPRELAPHYHLLGDI